MVRVERVKQIQLLSNNQYNNVEDNQINFIRGHWITPLWLQVVVVVGEKLKPKQVETQKQNTHKDKILFDSHFI